MKKFLLSCFCLISLNLHGAIYDCFPFFNELEVLRIRLEEIYDEVDYFVLVEATQTFSGNPKPLYFAENADFFKKYQDKIIHVIIDDYPVVVGDPIIDNWAREEHQRNAVMRGLTGCNDDDIIFISDTDEVIREEAVSKVMDYFAKKNRRTYKMEKSRKILKPNIVALDMAAFTCKLNKIGTIRWAGPSKAAPYWVFKQLSPNSIRLLHQFEPNLHMIKDGGWHFNSQWGTENAILRWKSLSTAYTIVEAEEYRLGQIYSDYCAQHRAIPIDSSFPKYVRNNIDYFRSVDMIEDLNEPE